MLYPPQKAGKMLKSIKQRLSGASGKTSSKITQSNLLGNLKRAIQSTPDLLKTRDGHYEHFSPPPFSQRIPEHFPSVESRSTCSSKSSEMECVVSSPANFQRDDLRGWNQPMPSEEVLFSPSNDAIKAAVPEKNKFKFALRKKKSLVDPQRIQEPTFSLPMITLTTPDDEQIYVLHRPTPPISSHTFLAVPNRSCPRNNISEPPYISAKKWPHPAGPWLRPTTSEENVYKTKGDQATWQEGWRLGNGNVIGWDPDCMDALGISFPPQLPTEQDLKTIALVEKISKSLDQAQDALYGSLQEAWDTGMDEDECEIKILEETGDFNCAELPNELHNGIF
ncbi:hypothetical protein PCANC_06331 [Puccinia coronata f. sp. avenae]|uniref:Uncharacterized protein n=1 Tax=Puccinia coronata f. sp. avenae TaxID=200324 RepID=A0A2N5T1S2_9BASI|nr:hypothetical protein PCASD_15669 [Puccinia coronata f. sp. avenae]PLW19432.1 hypothetical protein PCANC_06331 [Puccinia coronata f. sp. avenae]